MRCIASSYHDEQGYHVSIMQPWDNGTRVISPQLAVNKATKEDEVCSRTRPTSCFVLWNVKGNHKRDKACNMVATVDDAHEEVLTGVQPLGRTCANHRTTRYGIPPVLPSYETFG